MKYSAEHIAKFLSNDGKEFDDLNSEIKSILLPKTGAISEENLRALVNKFPSGEIGVFTKAKNLLKIEMSNVAQSISNLWETDRYIRLPYDLE